MQHNRLLVFARKPAPIQVCWLAYPGSTGLSAIDYRLTDPYLDPPGLFERFYSEETVRLPDCFWCYDPLSTEPEINALPAMEKGFITFGNLNHPHKVNDPVIGLWVRAMRAVERSQMVLLAPHESALPQILEAFEREGVDRKRVSFVEFQPHMLYMRHYQEIDIVLDTVPCNGHTTSLDALWMGVPVVTLTGPTVVGRGGLSILQNLKLPELIAANPDAFVEIAVGLARDLNRLSNLRSTLRDRMRQSPLMDAPRFASNIEAAYRLMWRRWCVGE
jgi:predicted O-linked N-acetylglucosamine transferase (SPINDLY family)